MKKTFLFLTALSAFALQGCTNTPEECDPSKELNVFSKASCQFSGSYDKRIEQKEKILLDEKATKAELAKINGLIKQQQAGVSKSIKQKQASLNSLNKSVKNLTAQLKQKAQGKTELLKDRKSVV